MSSSDAIWQQRAWCGLLADPFVANTGLEGGQPANAMNILNATLGELAAKPTQMPLLATAMRIIEKVSCILASSPCCHS
jgi:hypothetical protein